MSVTGLARPLRGFVLYATVLLIAAVASAQLDLGPEQILQGSGGDLFVPGYSVPSLADWNNDGLADLIVGTGGGGSYDAYIRVYPNIGSGLDPQFGPFSYVQSQTGDLIQDLTYVGAACPACGCMGLFPRVVYWDDDGRKDLLVGQIDGTVRLYSNIATDAAPLFDAGVFLQVGPSGAKGDIQLSARATPSVVDWNDDGRKDLLVGGLDGQIRVLLNEGTDAAPDFLDWIVVGDGSAPLIVPTLRSSPDFVDVTGDSLLDLLVGNSEGQLLLYPNTGAPGSPEFAGYSLVEAAGVPIDLPDSPRSRPFIADFNCDGLADVLIGAGDGRVHLYQGVPEPATILLVLMSLPALLKHRR